MLTFRFSGSGGVNDHWKPAPLGALSDGYAAVQCCEKWGVPYLGLSTHTAPFAHIAELRKAYTRSEDGTHPILEGYEKFYCDKIEAWLKTL